MLISLEQRHVNVDCALVSAPKRRSSSALETICCESEHETKHGSERTLSLPSPREVARSRSMSSVHRIDLYALRTAVPLVSSGSASFAPLLSAATASRLAIFSWDALFFFPVTFGRYVQFSYLPLTISQQLQDFPLLSRRDKSKRFSVWTFVAIK